MTCKREFCRCAPWDAHGMAAHLEKMEAKGWRFRGTNWLGLWEYERSEPREARWAVAYAPSRSRFRVTPTEQERDLEFLCFDAGWRKIAALSMFHIYRNADPDVTDLETDEPTRLETLDRALRGPMRIYALVRLAIAVFLLGVLLWLPITDLPKSLAMPALPGSVIFLVWLIASELIQYGIFRRWRKAAEAAALAGLSCPEEKHWRKFSRFTTLACVLILFWLLTSANLLYLLTYSAVMLAFLGLRWWLENRMDNEELAQKLFRAGLAACFILLFAINRFSTAPSSPWVESVPLLPQDLVDTTGMELYQYDLEGTDAPWASYHDYWLPDSNSSFDLRYTVFDLRLPFLEDACRDWFREDFDAIIKRWEQTVRPGDPVPWGADALWRSSGPDLYGWLIFYDSRIVFLATQWDLTPEQIAAAAEKLSP